jgi:antirestriction protein ArdC
MIDVYQTVTDRIIASLEAGRIPWKKEWSARASANVPSNFLSHKSYRGINVWLLMCAEYPSNQWLTYKQAQSIGAQVRKDETGSKIVFWKFGAEKDADTLKEKSWAMMREYTVFNIAQCDGVALDLPLEPTGPAFEPIESAELTAKKYLASSNSPALYHDGDRAFYSPFQDSVTLPEPAAFTSPAAYYSTLFHELGHSTLISTRCNREDALGSFGNHNYSREELVAEFTAAYLCAESGISNDSVELNHVAYIQSWLSKLRNDKKLAVSAAQKAQKAADFILLRSAAQLADAEQIAA